MAVVVVVADGHAHAVAEEAEARLLGDVGEVELEAPVGPPHTVVAEQARAGRLTRLAPVERRALEQQHVEVAVTVVVEQGPARAHDLGHEVLAARAGEVPEAQAGFFRDVAEQRRGRAVGGTACQHAEPDDTGHGQGGSSREPLQGGPGSSERRSRAMVAASPSVRAPPPSLRLPPVERALGPVAPRTQAAASA
jgi:hypothetical protein